MIANAITYCRIIISMLMFLFSVFSPEFYVCYLLAGISDMIDGTIARKLGTSSKFGEKLDTVADFVFAAAALFKLLPVMEISMVIWIWTGLIAVIKLINIISGFVVQKRFVTVHSLANKITGALFQCEKYRIFVQRHRRNQHRALLIYISSYQEKHLLSEVPYH